MGDATIRRIKIGPDIYALVGSPKNIPPALQIKIRDALAMLGYGKPPAALTAGVTFQFALFASLPNGREFLGQYALEAFGKQYSKTLFINSSLTGNILNNTIAHEFFHYYERAIQGVSSSEARADKFGNIVGGL